MVVFKSNNLCVHQAYFLFQVNKVHTFPYTNIQGHKIFPNWSATQTIYCTEKYLGDSKTQGGGDSTQDVYLFSIIMSM